jgi:hypothetical protein
MQFFGGMFPHRHMTSDSVLRYDSGQLMPSLDDNHGHRLQGTTTVITRYPVSLAFTPMI